MTQSLTERYDERIGGVLSCYDRVVIHWDAAPALLCGRDDPVFPSQRHPHKMRWNRTTVQSFLDVRTAVLVCSLAVTPLRVIRAASRSS
jgi:hypothetical protein